MTPFDQLASEYAARWSDTADGRAQRAQVWREIDRLFRAGDRVLDLGCGAGDDAVHLQENGVEALGIDSSALMVEIARDRGVIAQQRPIEDLQYLDGPFTGVISNFGALNCVRDLPAVARELARVVRPAGPAAFCIMGRFSWGETWRYLRSFEVRKAARRWSGHAQWRGLDVYYRSTREMTQCFAPYFRLERRVSIGAGDHQLYLFRRRTE